MFIVLADHNIIDNKYSSILISVIAVIGVEEYSDWVSVINYTSKISAIVKTIHIIAIYSIYYQREREVRKYQAAWEERELKRSAKYDKVLWKISIKRV